MMNRRQGNKTSVKRTTLICLLLLVLTSSVSAADITGIWELTMEISGRQIFGTLSISRETDGTLTGKWGSSDLSNVSFENEKLTFLHRIKFDDQDLSMNFNVVLEDGKLEGLFSSNRGEFLVKGSRKIPKSPALGHWDMMVNVDDQEISGKLSISQEPDGTLVGGWASGRGQTVISNVKFQDGKLTFSRKSTFGDHQYESIFVGTVKDRELTGAFMSQKGEIPATGQRIGASLIGEWELTSTSERGTRTGQMTVNGDLSGRYEFFGCAFPIKDLKLEGDQVTFFIEMGFSDQALKLDFQGKLDGKVLKGEMISEKGISQITGKKTEAVASIVGTWAFTRKTQRGTRTSTLKINDDMTGTYAFRNSRVAISDLTVDGDQVSFTIAVTVNDRYFQMDFKGKVHGDTLTGIFTTEQGSREVTGQRVN